MELQVIKDVCEGNIVHYNDEKGIGFISSISAHTNVFFHISNVVARNLPPRRGQSVSFSLTKQKDERLRATNVLIHNSSTGSHNSNRDPTLQAKRDVIEEFICVSSPAVRGCRISRSLGRVEARTVKVEGWWSGGEYYASSVNMSRNELIKRAKLLGANAILNFVYHSSYPPPPNFFSLHILADPKGGGILENAKFFWTEGEAVILSKI